MKDSPVREALTSWQLLDLGEFGLLHVRTSHDWVVKKDNTVWDGHQTIVFRESPHGPAAFLISVTDRC